MADPAVVPVAITFPSIDLTFARFVQRVVGERHDWTIEDLEHRLRRFLPTTRVHRREISGERPRYWYVFRDGRIVLHPSPDWWGQEATAHVTLDGEGTLIDLNEAAAQLYGAVRGDLVGIDYTDIIPEDARSDAALMLRSIIASGGADSLFPLQPLRGDPITIQFHAEVVAGRLEIDLRPATSLLAG